MATDWPAGAVFAVGWLLLWLPLFVGAIVWFHKRRKIQPIRARSPGIVLVTDVILLLYMTLLCLQRIIDTDYPCILSLWSGYVGTVVLLNVYLWRCWILYFNFNLTHVRLASLAPGTGLSAGSISDPRGSTIDASSNNFFLKHRWLTSTSFLAKVSVTTFLLLMVPPIVLSAMHPEIADQYGDVCHLHWGPSLLLAYVATYVALFSALAFHMRSVVDGFQIKAELKVTGGIALCAVIPWFLFNEYAASTNANKFPFSTLFLLLAIVAAFAASTIYPLHASIFSDVHQHRRTIKTSGALAYNADEEDDEDEEATRPRGGTFEADRLYKILDDPAGLEAFTQFLKREFSVENIVFYREIEKFRAEIRQILDDAMNAAPGATLDDDDAEMRIIARARKIHEKYIAHDAAYQVNLPDAVRKNCEAHLRYQAYQAGLDPATWLHELPPPMQLPPPASSPKFGTVSSVSHGGQLYMSTPEPEVEPEWLYPPPPQQPPMDHLQKDCPTLFDDAQRTIYMLMEKDSMLRFVRGDLYKTWYSNRKAMEHKQMVLAEMNLA